MAWKERLRILEKSQQWDKAIAFMKGIIQKNPNDVDAYIFMNYLLMNILAEEEYDLSKDKEYATLLKWYFDESYAKFSDNPEYLYFTAKTAVMGEWFFGITVKDYEKMFKRAQEIELANPLYQEIYYLNLSSNDPYNQELINFVRLALNKDSPMKKQLKDKGAIGEYILRMQQWWTRNALELAEKNKK